MNVDAVHQRTRDLAHVLFDLGRRTVAASPRVAAVTARTRIRRGDQHEVGWKGRAPQRPRDRDDAVFEWLTHHFERLAIELGQFIQKQDAVVGFADFTRRRAGCRRRPNRRR